MYRLHHTGHDYEVIYSNEALMVEIDQGAVPTGVEYPGGFADLPDYRRWAEWTAEEAAATLAVISDAIRAGTPIAELRFPHHAAPPPVYETGARRVYRVPEAFCRAHGVGRDRYGLAARDYERWHALWRRLGQR